LAESPEDFLLLPPEWQNSVRFPTARSNHANSYIAVIHHKNNGAGEGIVVIVNIV
jgi:hypothetical protein